MVTRHRQTELPLNGESCVCQMRVGVSRDCPVPFDFDRILDYVQAAANWIGTLRWSESIRLLDITLWLTPLRKIWCPQPEPTVNRIGRCEVNSGETAFPNRDERRITVWRAEDWSKVILHELFHAFGWDRLIPHTPDKQSEALVETMATLAHCQLLGGPDNWRTLLEREKLWMARQVAALQTYPWEPERTAVHSYYILKTALILNLVQFAAWLRQPELEQLKRSWTFLVNQSLNQLPPPPTPSSPLSCFPMRMVFAQLSLSPSPITH